MPGAPQALPCTREMCPGKKKQAKPRIPGGAAAAIPYLWARERAEALFDT